MHLRFWKKRKTGEVIHNLDYVNLPDHHKYDYTPTHESPTHQVEDVDDFGNIVLSSLLMGAVMDSGSSDQAVGDSQAQESAVFSGFDGGSAGGGGAEGDFTAASDSGSSDSGSSDSAGSDSGSSD